MAPVLLLCLGLGLLSGAMSTFYYQTIYWETFTVDPIAFSEGTAYDEKGSFMKTVENSRDSFQTLIDAFKFFPSFL